MLPSLLCKKIGAGNLRVHLGVSHFLLVFGEKALAIFISPRWYQDKSKALVWVASALYLSACSSNRSSITFPGPWQCVRSAPCFPSLLWSLGLMNYLGLWLTPDTSLLQPPTPQQTPLTDHMFFLPDPLAGLHPKLWYNAPASHTAPSEGFHREEKIWLPSKEPGHRLVRHQKLTPLELTTGLATLENNRGLHTGRGTPRPDPRK